MSVDHHNLLASDSLEHSCGTSGCRCSGNPTQSSCPVNRAYAMLDPGVNSYDSLDCSVVVYDVRRLLRQLDDEEKAEKVREELSECPCGAELVEVEEKLRGKLHDACCEHAPEDLRLRLLANLHSASASATEESGDGSQNKGDECAQ